MITLIRKTLAALVCIAALTSPVTYASEVAPFVDARIQLLEAQISQLNNAIELLQARTMTDQEKFELIGQPSFDAVNAALEQVGISLKDLYRFEEEYKEERELWLAFHHTEREKLEQLSAAFQQLQQTYDQLIQN